MIVPILLGLAAGGIVYAAHFVSEKKRNAGPAASLYIMNQEEAGEFGVGVKPGHRQIRISRPTHGSRNVNYTADGNVISEMMLTPAEQDVRDEQREKRKQIQIQRKQIAHEKEVERQIRQQRRYNRQQALLAQMPATTPVHQLQDDTNQNGAIQQETEEQKATTPEVSLRQQDESGRNSAISAAGFQGQQGELGMSKEAISAALQRQQEETIRNIEAISAAFQRQAEETSRISAVISAACKRQKNETARNSGAVSAALQQQQQQKEPTSQAVSTSSVKQQGTKSQRSAIPPGAIQQGTKSQRIAITPRAFGQGTASQRSGTPRTFGQVSKSQRSGIPPGAFAQQQQRQQQLQEETARSGVFTEERSGPESMSIISNPHTECSTPVNPYPY